MVEDMVSDQTFGRDSKIMVGVRDTNDVYLLMDQAARCRELDQIPDLGNYRAVSTPRVWTALMNSVISAADGGDYPAPLKWKGLEWHERRAVIETCSYWRLIYETRRHYRVSMLTMFSRSGLYWLLQMNDVKVTCGGRVIQELGSRSMNSSKDTTLKDSVDLAMLRSWEQRSKEHLTGRLAWSLMESQDAALADLVSAQEEWERLRSTSSEELVKHRKSFVRRVLKSMLLFGLFLGGGIVVFLLGPLTVALILVGCALLCIVWFCFVLLGTARRHCPMEISNGTRDRGAA